MVSGGASLTVLLVFALGGLLFGALVMYLVLDAVRSQREAREVVHTQPLTKAEMEVPIVEVPAFTTVENKILEENLLDEDEVDFAIGRDQEDGRLRIEMDGHWHDSIESLNALQRERLQQGLRESASWLGLLLAREQVVEPKAAVTAGNPPTKVVVPVNELPSRKLTIVEQVDEILQDILEAEGLQDRNIRLSDMVNRGVIVWIGQQFYEGIEAVPDVEVKQLVRRAVRKWEETASSM